MTNADENHFQPIEPDFSSEQMRAMVGRTKETLRRSDAKPIGTEKEKGRLTAKQRLFVSYMVQGLSQREAYRKAYNNTNDNEGTIASNANKVANDPKVKALLEASLDKSENALLSDSALMRRHIMSELLRHSQEMKGDAQKLRALELMGKAVGMYTDKVETTVEQINPEALKDELSKHLALLDQVTKH